MHRAPTTAMLSQVVHVANRKRRWYYSLDKWQIISTLIATIFECLKHQDDNHDGDQQSHHNDQPLYQRIALVKKKSSNDVTFYTQLMSEHAEDLRYKPCATVDLSSPCRTRAKPNMTSNATINVVMQLNVSKRQCPSTITITVIATIIVLCQHTRKTNCT